MTIKCKMKIKEWRPRRISQSQSKELTKREKFRRLSSNHVVRKPNNLRSLSNRMSRKRSSRALKLSRRTAWRIRSSTSRRGLLRWRSKKTGRGDCNKSSASMTKGSTMRTIFASRRKKKSCRWRSWRWSLSRSSRIRKLSRRMHTKSLSVHWRNLAPWWHHLESQPLTQAVSERMIHYMLSRHSRGVDYQSINQSINQTDP